MPAVLRRLFAPLLSVVTCCTVLFAAEISFKAVPDALVLQRLDRSPSADADRGAAVRTLFAEAGCPAEQLTEQRYAKSREPNIVCELPGTGAGVIVVGAHFDKVKAGRGIADNWSGAALLASLYEGLNRVPRQHTYRFIAFSAEELGLVGSHSYVRTLSKEERQTIAGMVNLDTLGVDSPMVWTETADQRMFHALANVAQSLKIPLRGLNFSQVGSTDSESFRTAKVPAITLSSITAETFGKLHT